VDIQPQHSDGDLKDVETRVCQPRYLVTMMIKFWNTLGSLMQCLGA